MPRLRKTATIASGESLSGAIDLSDYRIASLDMPTAWTTATLTFQVSNNGTSYANLYDDAGNEVDSAAAAGRAISPGADLSAQLAGHRYVKIRSGTAASAVAQEAARSIVLGLLPA